MTDEPLFRIPVNGDVRWRALTGFLLYSVAALLAWSLLPRMYATPFLQDVVFWLSLGVAALAVWHLVWLENGYEWVKRRDAQLRHQARLQELLEEVRRGR